jgi:hypothetical protein
MVSFITMRRIFTHNNFTNLQRLKAVDHMDSRTTLRAMVVLVVCNKVHLGINNSKVLHITHSNSKHKRTLLTMGNSTNMLQVERSGVEQGSMVGMGVGEGVATSTTVWVEVEVVDRGPNEVAAQLQLQLLEVNQLYPVWTTFQPYDEQRFLLTYEYKLSKHDESRIFGSTQGLIVLNNCR